MSDLSDQVQRNTSDIRNLDQYMSAISEHTLQFRSDLAAVVSVVSDVNQVARQNREDINAIFQITRENAEGMRELRARQLEIQAGQDENRAILNQILRRDQERGS